MSERKTINFSYQNQYLSLKEHYINPNRPLENFAFICLEIERKLRIVLAYFFYNLLIAVDCGGGDGVVLRLKNCNG